MFRLTNVIQERIIFVSRGITVCSEHKAMAEAQKLINTKKCYGK